MDDAYNFLRLRGLKGNHCTAPIPNSTDLINQFPRPSVLQTSSRDVINGKHSNFLPKLLVWSTADKAGLSRVAKSYSTWAIQICDETLSQEEAELFLKNLAYTLAYRRSSMTWKSFSVINSLSEMQSLPSKLSIPIRSNLKPRLGYIFTGQGAQYAKMDIELLAFDVFKTSMRMSEIYLREFGCEWLLLGMWELSISRLTNTLPH